MSDETTTGGPRFVDFFGEQFQVPDRINQRLVIRFGRLAAEGADTADEDPKKAAEAAILLDRMVEQMVRPEDKDRFEDACDRERVSDEELMRFIAQVMAAVSGRPTSLPSGSSDGQRTTPPSSEAASSSLRVVRRLEESGRPDLALMVEMAQEARSTA